MAGSDASLADILSRTVYMSLDRFQIVVITVDSRRRSPLRPLEIGGRISLAITRSALLVALVAGQRASLRLAARAAVFRLFRVAVASQSKCLIQDVKKDKKRGT
jgi:hypothetical protein